MPRLTIATVATVDTNDQPSLSFTLRQIEEIFQTEEQVTDRRRARHAILECDPAVQVARAARRVRAEQCAAAPVDATLGLIKQLRWDNQPVAVASAA